MCDDALAAAEFMRITAKTLTKIVRLCKQQLKYAKKINISFFRLINSVVTKLLLSEYITLNWKNKIPSVIK